MRRIARSPLCLLLGPCIAAVAALLVVPLLNIGFISFREFSPTKILADGYTLANYAALLDGFHLRLFGDTARIGLLTTLACIILGYPLAYMLARTRPTLMAIGLFLVVAPMMVSTVIRVFGWTITLGRNGIVNKMWAALGFEGRLSLLNTEGAVIIGLTSIFLPFMVLPLMSSIERIPRNVEEAACNLGAGCLQTFVYVIFPLTIPGLASGSLLVFSSAISAFVIPALLGGRHVRVVGSEIYDALLVSFNWPSAAALSFTLLLLAMSFVFVALRLGHRQTARRD